MKSLDAPAKINLALVVGPRRPDGKHEVATVLQRIELSDRISLESGSSLDITGFPEDTLVRDALLSLASAAAVDPHWSMRIEKRIPVAAGLGGGSSDAATALRLANETLAQPFEEARLHELATALGSDVPFFLTTGTQLGTGDGSELRDVDLPRDYAVLLVLPSDETKSSTAEVYGAFAGADGFEGRRTNLVASLEGADLAGLPPNDLVSSPIAAELRGAGAFRADVTGAGPAVYGLFTERERAAEAGDLFADRCEIWLTAPAW
jgi:4-diphosphocytidyl-2-C-methyl-D-erythritol kinase